MQHLDTLWKVVNAASSVRDLAFDARTQEFHVQPPITFYLHAQYAQIYIRRWSKPQVTIQTLLQARFGWRIHSEQDEAGVYLVAKRRAIVGGIAQAKFEIRVPVDTYLVLRTAKCQLTLDDLNGEYHIPPPAGTTTTAIVPK